MKKKQRFETQLMRLSLLASLPLLGFLLLSMYLAGVSIWLIILSALIGSLLVAYTAYKIHEKAEYQFRSLSNLLEAMTHGEYSMRAVSDHTGGAHDELVVTINGLAETLARQKWEASESQLLVNTVIDHIDVAIVALDEKDQVSFLNPAAQELFQLPSDTTQNLLDELNELQPLSSGQQKVVELTLGKQRGRFNIYIEEFRKHGEQHKLLFISDVTFLLRSEERKAWQSLVRVISHEINNSLSPIASISQTLKQYVTRSSSNGTLPTDDIEEGLTLIGERAKGLAAFVESYEKIAQLPEPDKHQTSLADLVQKTCSLFENNSIRIASEGNPLVNIDPIQIEQVLINLIKNAIEANTQNKIDTDIEIKWKASRDGWALHIKDNGPGIKNPDNLFVPFYSTKKSGSGIGLVLCRQIIEAHDGRLTVTNRTNRDGACATIELPN